MSNVTSDRRISYGKVRALSILCIIFLIVPDFNIIDLLPDFIPYLILANFFGKYADYAPYFAEAKESFGKLALVSALKLPAFIVMMLNIGSGMDIVPLFTFIFTAIEIMLLLPAVSAAFSALFYLGERGVMRASIERFSFFSRKKNTYPDSARMMSYVFLISKSVLNFLPNIFLLTRARETNAEMIEAIIFRSAFPTATFICMGAILVAGILWAVMLHSYAMGIVKEGRLHDAALDIAGEARLRELEGERSVRRLLHTLTVLMLSSLLCFDVAFSNVNDGVNILPHFLYALLIIGLSARVCECERDRKLILGCGILYSAVSLIEQSLLSSFVDKHYYSDIGNIPAADNAYLYVKICAVAELLCFAFFIFLWARSLVKFILKHTTLSMSDERYGAPDAEFNRKISIKAYIFAYFPLFIALLKCLEVFIRAEVRYIVPGSTSEISTSTIVTSSAPWFGFLILGFTIAYAFYSYYFINEAKDEVKLKYSNEKQSFE